MAKEVAIYIDELQFQAGHSEMKCGYYAVAQNYFAGHTKARGAPGDIETLANAWYVKYDGSDTPDNPRGMSLPQLYSLIGEAGNHWQNLFPDGQSHESKDLVREWVKAGYPVIVALDEATVYDQDLHANPYSWHPKPGQFTHIITITGIQENGVDFLCRDTANIGPDGVRPGPRKYARTPMELVSATVFVPDWMARPTSLHPTPVKPTPVPTPATDYKKKARELIEELSGIIEKM